MHRDMGLYDDRLADLSESRRPRRGAAGREPSSRVSASSTSVQSLLFDRSAGWTTGKAKAWAKSHGYSCGQVDVTGQYVRVRQSDSKVKRTTPLGKGIRAVVAREESMATKKSRRRSKKKAASSKRKAPRRRHARKVAMSKPVRRKRRKTASVARKATRRRARRVKQVAETKVVQAPRRRKRRKARRMSHVQAWRGDSAGHSKAAKKGARRRKAKRSARRKTTRRRRSRKMSESKTMVASPRRRRRKSRRVHASKVVGASKRRTRRTRRSRRMRASSGRSGRGLQAAEMALALLSGGIGFILADGLDRFLATYNPGASQELPKNKFTSTGAGTLANTLNVASKPSLIRIGAGIGMTVLPAVASVYVDRPLVRASLEGAAVGAGVSLFKTLWNNLLMPLLAPKDTSVRSLQTSYIARLYPAEVAAHINLSQQGSAIAPAAGVLSAPPAQTGVGADVGPFALAGDSPYPDAAQALRKAAGVQDYPTLQNTWGTGGPGNDYPTAAQALRKEAGMAAWEPGPPSTPGPGPQQGNKADCGCVGETNAFLGFIEGVEEQPLFNAGDSN